MTQFPLVHLLNLDTIGGVESLYIHFIQKSSENNFTVVSGKQIHPIYLQKLAVTGSRKPVQEQYIYGFRLPKILRWITSIRRIMVEHVFTGQCRWIFWNRIEERKPSQESIYYEHGASWMTEKSVKKERFIHSMRKVIANSHASQIFLSELWGLNKEDIPIVENPLRPDIEIIDLPRELDGKIPLRLGYVGRLIPLKCPSIALYTLYNLRKEKIDATLDIAGVGIEEPFLRQLAQKLGIDTHIRFLHVVENMNSFYDSIDLLIIPSIREPLGLVALEASARGVPVIGSSVDGLAESVINGVSGILIRPTIDLSLSSDFISKKENIPEKVVDPIEKRVVDPRILNPISVAESIKNIIETPSLYRSLSQGGLHHVQNRISFDTYVDQIMNQFLTPPLLNEEFDDFD